MLARCISWRFGASIAVNVADELGVTTKMAFGISGTAQQQKCSRLMRVCCASIGITERVMFFNVKLKKDPDYNTLALVSYALLLV